MGTKHIYDKVKEKDVLFATSGGHAHSGSDSTVVSHSNLSGLTTGDDHTQYLHKTNGGTITGAISLQSVMTLSGSGAITGVPAPSAGGDAANKSYVDSVTQGLAWQDHVIDATLSSAPGSPTTGDRYIVAEAGYAAVTAVNQGTKTFTVGGDVSGNMGSGDIIRIRDSTGNNGWYTVVSATFVTDHTDIVVSETIPSATADGNLGWATNGGGWDTIGPGMVVEYNGSTWDSYMPEEGWAIWCQAADCLLVFTDSNKWVQFGSTISHDTLQDVSENDHHNRQHGLQSTLDHTSTATSGQMLKADANGLPVDATNTDAEVSSAVSASHTQLHAVDSTSDHTVGSLTNGYLVKASTSGAPLQNATNTDAQVSAAVSASHTRAHDMDSASDHNAMTAGAILYGAVSTGAVTELPIGTANYVLKSSGTVPQWGQVAYSELTGIPSTFTPSQHSLQSTTYHSSTATSGQMLKADANGLPVDATNTDAEVSAAVSASHTRSHNMDSASDHSAMSVGDIVYGAVSTGAVTRLSIGTQGQVLTVSASGVPAWEAAGTPGSHDIDGVSHTLSGATTGTILKATSATTFAFGELSDQAGGKMVISNGRTLSACVTLLGGEGTVYMNNDDASTTSVSQADLTVNGIGMPVFSVSTITFSGARTVLNGLKFTGRLVASGTDAVIENCRFETTGTGEENVQLSAANAKFTKNVVIDSSTGTFTGVNCESVEAIISNNFIQSNNASYWAIMLRATNILVVGNRLENNGVSGMVITSTGANACTVTGNQLYGRFGLIGNDPFEGLISVTTGNGHVVTSNFLENNSANTVDNRCAIHIETSYNLIADNVITDGSATNNTYGIYVASGTGNRIGQNSFVSNIDVPFYDAGTSTEFVIVTTGLGVSGDVLYCSAAGVWSRLAKGSDGQVLKLASGLPSWADDAVHANQDGWLDVGRDETASEAEIEMPDTIVEQGTGPSSGWGLSTKIVAESGATVAMAKCCYFYLVQDDFNSWPSNNLPVSIWCDEVATTTIEVSAFDDTGTTILAATTFNKGGTPDQWVTNNFTLSASPSPGARLTVVVQIGKSGGYIPASAEFRVFFPKPQYRRYA